MAIRELANKLRMPHEKRRAGAEHALEPLPCPLAGLLDGGNLLPVSLFLGAATVPA